MGNVRILHIVNVNGVIGSGDLLHHVDRLFTGRAARAKNLNRVFCRRGWPPLRQLERCSTASITRSRKRAFL